MVNSALTTGIPLFSANWQRFSAASNPSVSAPLFLNSDSR